MNTSISSLFADQQAALPRLRAENTRQRLKRIQSIRRYLMDRTHEKRLSKAMWGDLRKPETEVVATEIGPLLMAIRHIRGHLATWMRDQPRPSPLSMVGMRSRIQYEPKGNCLVLSPWNYPLQLSLMATVHAIAAGNAVIIKPSELSPHTSAFVEQMIQKLFDPSECAVVTGGGPVAEELLEQPFDHIFFTGSPQVGKLVMAAAARHLSSVTLELGGKSPVVIDGTRRIRKTATQLAWAKALNAGQTCIAPDYAVLPKSEVKGLVAGFAKATERFYNREGEGIAASQDYGRIVSDKHFQRLEHLVEDALTKGAKLAFGGERDAEERFFAPTLLTEVNESMDILQEEIFGPILPLVTFDQLEEVPEILRCRPKPLAFYIQSNSRKNTRYLLDHSSAGGTVINDFMVSSLNPHLPFGGVNHSGIGKSNGRQGFIEFSNERGIVTRNWGNFAFLYPPFKPGWNRWLKQVFDKL